MDGGACAAGTVTFQLSAAPGHTLYVGLSGDSPLPDSNWLTVFCPAGRQLYTEVTGLTGGADCSNCNEGYSWPIGGTWQELPDGGTVTQTWDGLFYAVGHGCPDVLLQPPPGEPGLCVTQECAPPGPYVAMFCACDSSILSGQVPACAHPTCINVPFDYPSTGVVSGTL